MNGFDQNPAMDAAIENKIASALTRGIDLASLNPEDAGHYRETIEMVGITADEAEYMAKRSILKSVQIELGKQAVAAMNASNFKIDRKDLMECLTAYFEALDAGEVEEAA